MNTAKCVATSLVTLLLVGWSFPAIAQQDKALQKLIEGAKKEAKLRIGLTMRWQEAGKPSGRKSSRRFKRVIRSSRLITSGSAARASANEC